MRTLSHWQCCANAVVGVLLLLSPWVLGFLAVGVWLVVMPWAVGLAPATSGAVSAWASGALLIGLGVWSLVCPCSYRAVGAVGVVGVWAVVTPWLPGFAPAHASSLVEALPAAVVVLLSLWAVNSIHEGLRTGRRGGSTVVRS